jgi:DNA polymerase I-like protein with 3'-5' exonuclease and polymerase domains
VATDNLHAHGQAFIRGIDGRILAMAETDDRYYAFTNWQIQSTANVVLKQRLAAIDNMGLAEFMIAAIHDEVVAEIPEDFEEEYRILIEEAMSDDSTFSLPIVCATGDGAVRWGDAK